MGRNKLVRNVMQIQKYSDVLKYRLTGEYPSRDSNYIRHTFNGKKPLFFLDLFIHDHNSLLF